MNHIPLHPFAIKSHPNLIPSLPNLPPMFPPFLPFPDTPSLRHSATRHLSLRHSVVVILHYQFPSLPSFVISDLIHPYSVPSIILGYVAGWSPFNIFTFLWRTIILLSSDLMTSFLVISYSWVQYPFISVFLYIRNSCTSARLQFVID